MGLINWIFDLYQHHKIQNAHDEAARLRAEMDALRTTRGTIDDERVLRAVGELALAVKTLQRLCVEKGLCSAGEFQARLRAIDGEDGRTDGMAPLP